MHTPSPRTQCMRTSAFRLIMPTTTTLSELKEGAVGTLDVPTLCSWIDDGAPA